MSKHVRKISRDDELWRQICFDHSYFTTTNRRRELRLEPRSPTPEELLAQQLRVAARSTANSAEVANYNASPPEANSSPTSSADHVAERTRALANWDPLYATEKVDWYGEYVARHAPLSMTWLEPPEVSTNEDDICDVKGLGYYVDPVNNKVIAPIEDGSVGVWDVGSDGTPDGSRDNRRGAIQTRSKPGLLSSSGASNSSGSHSTSLHSWATSAGVIECISIDKFRKKAYIAIEHGLNEVDLETLQISGFETFPHQISALSKAEYPVPMTIGTTNSLYLHDPRRASNVDRNENGNSERVENIANFPASPRPNNDFYRLLLGDKSSVSAPLNQPGPLSILHFASSGTQDLGNGEIYVGGRFPSILIYDRRCFPKLQGTIHSGARLCSLASLLYPFKALEVDLMRQNQLSISEVQTYKSQAGSSLIACGEYNGKGSLEIYGLAPDTSTTSTPSMSVAPNSVFKNRVSASSSKLLSVATHGTRLVLSDGDGQLKWLERDGSTLVRRWNINEYHQRDGGVRGLFNTAITEANTGDVARKILPTNEDLDVPNPRVDGDRLLVWTGEKIGLVEFSSKPHFKSEDWEPTSQTVEEQEKRREQDVYGETMRRALERQADEVRFVRGLGFGR